MAMSNLSTIAPSLADYAPYYYQFRSIHRFLVGITYPYIFFISFVGFVTNTLTVILLSNKNVTKNLKNKWTLIALAISDLLFNTVLLVRGIHDLTKIKSDRICLIVSFLSHLAELLSACYTVAFTIQRYYAIRCPLEAAVRRRSSPIVSLLMIFTLSIFFCLLMTYYNNYEDCLEELYLNWFIADAFFSFAIPVMLILIFNALIINYIRKRTHRPVTREASLFSKRQLTNADDMDGLQHNPATVLSAALSQDDGNEYIELNEPNGMNQSFAASPSERVSLDTVSLNRQSRMKTHCKRYFCRQKQISIDSYSSRISNNPSSQYNENESIDRLSMRASQSIHVTRMLVLVSTCFLLLNAPGHICVIILKMYIDVYNRPVNSEHIFTYNDSSVGNSTSDNDLISSSQPKQSTTSDQLTIHLLYTAVLFTQLIAYASYSTNFFLYSFSGITFRTSLHQLIRRLRKH